MSNPHWDIVHQPYPELLEREGILNVTGLSEKEAKALIASRNWAGRVGVHTGSPISLSGGGYGMNAYLVCDKLSTLLSHTDGYL